MSHSTGPASSSAVAKRRESAASESSRSNWLLQLIRHVMGVGSDEKLEEVRSNCPPRLPEDSMLEKQSTEENGARRQKRRQRKKRLARAVGQHSTRSPAAVSRRVSCSSPSPLSDSRADCDSNSSPVSGSDRNANCTLDSELSDDDVEGLASDRDDNLCETRGLDLNSAFARAKLSAALSLQGAGRAAEGGGENRVLKGAAACYVGEACQLALQGNVLVWQGNFSAAIRKFTTAIRLSPSDHRFYGNRSLCFEKKRQFDKALKDADRAIDLNPDWPKGHFRRGRALLGQKRYDESEVSLRRALSLDGSVVECRQDLVKINSYRLQQLGFSRAASCYAARLHDTFPEVLNAVTSASFSRSVQSGFDYSSDSDDIGQPDLAYSAPSLSEQKQNPVEPMTSLWVGNVADTVTEKDVEALFSKYGAVISIRLLLDRHCAFVNFRDSDPAAACLGQLQGLLFHGKLLKLRYPNRVSCQQSVSGGSPVPCTSAKASAACASVRECFFWRHSHCVYGASCRFRHVPAHRLIDRKV